MIFVRISHYFVMKLKIIQNYWSLFDVFNIYYGWRIYYRIFLIWTGQVYIHGAIFWNSYCIIYIYGLLYIDISWIVWTNDIICSYASRSIIRLCLYFVLFWFLYWLVLINLAYDQLDVFFCWSIYHELFGVLFLYQYCS